jgi:signal transduction histidine kinase
MKTTPGHLLLQALRTRAEARLPQQLPGSAEEPAPTTQVQHLLLELETHQLELEMQNDELLAAQSSIEYARTEAEQARNAYIDLFEQAPVAYVTLTGQDLIERVNQQACQLLEVTGAGQLVARRFLLFVAPASRPAAAEWLAQLQTQGTARACTELEIMTEKGTVRTVQLSGVASTTAAGAWLCRLTLLDLSERNQAAADLRRSQERTRLALAASGAGVIEWDCTTDLLYLDETARTLFGLPGPPMQLPLQALRAQVLPADQPALANALNRAAVGESLAVQFRVLDGAGPPRHLAAHGEVVFETGTRLQFIGQLRDVTEYRRAHEEAAALRLSQQQAVFEAVLATQEEERRRMAETLHNGIGQLLYLMKLRLAQAIDPPAKAVLLLLDEAIRDVRALSAELAPSVLEDFGLKLALETMAKRVPRKKLRVHCNFLGLDVPLSATLQTLVYRMVQELLNNVLKHAEAEEVFLHVVREDNLLTVNVDDDGQGFVCADSEPPGIGLVGIRSQVTRLGGQLHINSMPGRGTAISIELPLAPDAPQTS